MTRIVKCRHCNITDTPRSNMEFELVGKAKPVRKYYHKECYKEFLKEKAFKEEESKELDSLKLTIEKIFNIKQLPHQAYPLLQNMRNGEQVFGRQDTGKRYKEGYKYSLIEETFKHCEDTIDYWLNNKDFKGFMNAFKYSLTIVIDKIYFVEQKVDAKESSRRMMEIHIDNAISNNDVNVFESSYEKKDSRKREDDIMDFLD